MKLIGGRVVNLGGEALCTQVDAEIFFPEKGGSSRAAKAVCLRCDERVECLEYALENNERWGVWGGMSERERRKIKDPKAEKAH